jgi:hypothetical protein
MSEPIFGNFRGKVVDNNDPEQKGRIKVEIYPYFHNVKAEYLPWSVPASPLFCGAGVGLGNFSVPEVNSFVWCFFEAGNLYQPVYFAEAPDFVHIIGDEKSTNYPKRKILKTSSGLLIIIDDEVPSISLTYENGIGVIIDQSVPFVSITHVGGTSIVVNAAIPSIDITHPGGASMSVDAAGNISITGTTVNINPPAS